MRKKIMIFILLTLIGVLFVPNKISGYTNSTNLIDPDKVNVEIIPIEDELGFRSTELKITDKGRIDIKSNVEYFIVPTYINRSDFPGFNWYDMPLFLGGVAQIGTYDHNGQALELLTLTKKLIISPGILVGYAVTFGEDVKSITINNFTLPSQSLDPADFTNVYQNLFNNRIDYMLLMIDAGDIKNLPEPTAYEYQKQAGTNYDISNLYLGEDASVFEYGKVYEDEKAPIITSNRYQYTTFVDNPVTIPELIAAIELTAIDEIDGDLTSQINYDATEYETNVLNKSITKERLLGDFDIIFSVSDSSGNMANCVISITVVDDQKPVVAYDTSILSYQLSIEDEMLALETILNNINVTDNYSDVSHEVLSNNYHGYDKDLGDYQIDIKYMDEALNEIVLSVLINIVDDIAPTISFIDNIYQVSYKNPKPILEILYELEIKVIDNYDINSDFQVVINEYTDHESILGNYLVRVEAIDSSNNKSFEDIMIKVIDDIDPIFYLNETKVTISSKDLLGVNKIKGILTERKLVKNSNFEIEIIYDEYSENSSKAGTYDLRLKINYKDGSTQYEKFTINVTNDSEKKNNSILIRIWSVILSILLFVWNIIKWPFEQLFRLFH